MAVIASFAHARNFRRAHQARAALEFRDVATTADGQPVVDPLPSSVKVLTAFFVILGALVLGIITWRIVVWRRRKAFPASATYRQSSFIPSEKIRPLADGAPSEKSEVLVILPIEPPAARAAESGKWVPQIRSVGGGGGGWVPQKFGNTKADTVAFVDIKHPEQPPRPPALNLPPVTAAVDEHSNLLVPAASSPVPSPRRTSSFLDTPQLKAKPSIKVTGQKLPRRMLVEHTFVPSLADELSIKVGDVLQMLEEYEDEWCLVERIGSRAGERGVVPRFCLKERPRGHKRGASSASHASSTKSGASRR
ncbi:uncharacterized protein BXZ73DRAFT_102328 [Epithele typhae]|uniref:uncharacterized protein n=1 Tax=Epithele typhae TaxID=378194 RepID=UPI00200851D8|nr:uncharacterized protein BXZ73DRAFT_102328 [Epithele typhae]KAH9928487.1 hypothetical protein BXZ73DRAFT_102328 [Epithele typhae]